MRRIFALLVGLVFSAAISVGQGTVTDQSPSSAGQQNPNSVSSVLNSNGTVPTNAQGSASRTPSAPSQSLPGNANPANASTEGSANGQAVMPQKSKSAPPGTAAGNTPPADRDGARPPSTNAPDELAKPGLLSTMPWLWAGMGVVGSLILIGILMRRDRSRDISERRNTTVVTMDDRDVERRDDDIRRVG
jgi:hypothetical protein